MSDNQAITDAVDELVAAVDKAEIDGDKRSGIDQAVTKLRAATGELDKASKASASGDEGEGDEGKSGGAKSSIKKTH